MNVSIVVPAHNEGANIGHLLESFLQQVTHVARVVEIVVVASGCTDDTAEVARRIGKGRPGMHVHVQERREGKVAAINAFLRMRDPRAEVVVISSADLLVAPDVVEKLVLCLEADPSVGMAGARPVPDNDPGTLVGKMVNVLWEMHHKVSLEVPKMGELVAFRASLVEHVSELSVVDEASVEDIVRSKGYKLAYVPDAIVRNHGPERLGEYFEQRRRIARGHYWLEFAFGYEVATLDRGLVAKNALEVAKHEDRFGKLALGAAVATEVCARLVGFWDARVVGGKHRVWKSLQSTKALGAEARGALVHDERLRRLSARPEPPEEAPPVLIPRAAPVGVAPPRPAARGKR